MYRGEMKLKTVWISYRSFWPTWNFKPAWDFHLNIIYPKRNELAQTRWILRLITHVRLKLNAGMDFIPAILTEMKFHFGWILKYHVNTNRNEMPTHVHQNIGSFWNAVEMKLHVNRTCFHAGLKTQTGMGSFCLSCERTLSKARCN